MVKLVLHITVAVALWLGLSYFTLHWGIKFGAVVGGAAFVHIIYERFIFNPFRYLGAMPFAPDDPLMLQALGVTKRCRILNSRRWGNRMMKR